MVMPSFQVSCLYGLGKEGYTVELLENNYYEWTKYLEKPLMWLKKPGDVGRCDGCCSYGVVF